MKKCPFCAEEIQEEAVKCKHCGEFLIDAELRNMKSGGDGKWYHKTPTVIISVICFGPLALPLIWFNPKYSIAAKVIWTIIIIAVTLLLCIGSIEVYVQFLKSIEKMGL
jgi:hypothetical protein